MTRRVTLASPYGALRVERDAYTTIVLDNGAPGLETAPGEVLFDGLAGHGLKVAVPTHWLHDGGA